MKILALILAICGITLIFIPAEWVGIPKHFVESIAFAANIASFYLVNRVFAEVPVVIKNSQYLCAAVIVVGLIIHTLFGNLLAAVKTILFLLSSFVLIITLTSFFVERNRITSFKQFMRTPVEGEEQ